MLRVIAASVQPFEVRVAGWDLANVLGPVEPPTLLIAVPVQSDGDNAAAVLVGQSVVVVPAVGAALVRVAVRSHPCQRDEHGLAGVGQRHCCVGRSVCTADRRRFEVRSDRGGEFVERGRET